MFKLLVATICACLTAATLGAQGAGTGRGAGVLPPPPPPGDAANGKALVAANKCLDCHRVGETGSRVGPDLTQIGATRTPANLIESIVKPDQEVLPENRSVRVVLKDGTSVTGRILNQDALSVQLINDKEQLKSYLRANLREATILDKGLMPSYEGKLTTQQVNDIVNYLASLKGAQ
jgi:quinoprotein glucose dehydrogenase